MSAYSKDFAQQHGTSSSPDVQYPALIVMTKYRVNYIAEWPEMRLFN